MPESFVISRLEQSDTNAEVKQKTEGIAPDHDACHSPLFVRQLLDYRQREKVVTIAHSVHTEVQFGWRD